MSRVSITWTIEEIPELSHRGERQCIVTEHWSDGNDPTIWGPMPGRISDAFIRVRREQVARDMKAEGGFNLADVFPEGEPK